MEPDEVQLEDRPAAETSARRTESRRNTSRAGALTIEFQYYGGIIRNLEPILTDPGDRKLGVEWIKKLFGIEYHVEILRDKRNRYLATLAINMINDKTNGVFEALPPEGPLPEIDELSIIVSDKAEWEKDTTWSEFNSAMPDGNDEISCSFHPNENDCEEDVSMNEQLEKEFCFLLYQIRPCAAMIPCPHSRSRVTYWIHTLCRLSMKRCYQMKFLRNEYAYALYSCVSDLTVAGPFKHKPPRRTLPPLADLTKRIAERYPLTSPYNSEANAFMETQPNPDEGAICYVAVTGDMFDSNKLPPR